MHRNKFYRHKSWCLLFSSTKKLFIHSCLWSLLTLIMSHWTRSKLADEEGTPCLPSFKSVNHRRPLSPFWQISSSSPIGCGIMLSVSLWHRRKGRTRAPHCCNYITTSLAAPQPLTQLFLETVSFIVSFERMWSLSQNKSSNEGWGSDSVSYATCTRQRMHNASGMALTDFVAK